MKRGDGGMKMGKPNEKNDERNSEDEEDDDPV
jgi:hypothetical protein